MAPKPSNGQYSTLHLLFLNNGKKEKPHDLEGAWFLKDHIEGYIPNKNTNSDL